MSWRMVRNSILAMCAAGAAMAMSGCGSSSNANVITVTVTPAAAPVLAGQVQNFTATVGGSTTLTVQWSCTYVYTPLPTTAVPNPTPIKTPLKCNSGDTVNGGSIGTWTISDANSSNVLTYTAPSLSNFPNPIPIITFTAKADADQKKSGTGQIGLDSGIRVAVTPTAATIPVGLTPPAKQPFSPSFQNANPQTARFALVQPDSSKSSTNPLDTTANPLAETCDPTCGTIDPQSGVYTAPTTLPADTKPPGSKSTSPTTVFVVVWSSADVSHFNVATITLVNASTNAVSYKGLFPKTIAAGGLLQDVFLDARNLLNTTQIFFLSPRSADALNQGQGPVPLDNATQVFTIPISKAYCTPNSTAKPPVDCDASILTRVRLFADQLKEAEPVVPAGQPPQPAWIMVALPGTPTPSGDCVAFPGSPSSIACPIHITNTNPALVSAVPDGIPQDPSLGTVSLGAIGGYYGAKSGRVNLNFADQQSFIDITKSGARQVFSSIDNSKLPAKPGLYEVSVSSTTNQGTPPRFPNAITNVAVQPAFTTAPTATSVPLHTNAALGPNPNLAPSAMALNTNAGYAVIAEQATSTLQFVDLTGTSPAQVGGPVPLGGTASAPTDIAIDSQIQGIGGDLGIVVSSGDSRLYFYSLDGKAGTATPLPGVPSLAVDLQTLIGQPTATGLPAAVSFGVDPTSHLGLVAYVNTNIGFIVDVNPNLDGSDTRKCFLGPSVVPPCVVAPVSFNTGTSPKVVMQPNVPLAYVTPGGGNGVTSVVDLLQKGTTVSILPFSSTQFIGAQRTAGITTIHTATPHGINAVLGGTVIISGIQATIQDPTKSNFNGTFNIIPGSVSDIFTFSYVNPGEDDVEKNPAGSEGTVTYGSPYFSFRTSTFVSGAAINPITRTLAFANFNDPSGQIGFISTLDQSPTSLNLSAGSCGPNPSGVSCTPSPAGAPEIGFRSVSFDPFRNILIAFNPTSNSSTNFAGNEISLINPGGPAPDGSTHFPYRIIAGIDTGQTGQGSYTPQGQTAVVTVYGPMIYDPKSKFVLVANAGSNTLTFMNLDADASHPFQSAHIQDLQLPNPPCLTSNLATCYGVPVVQPPLDSNNPAHAPGVCSPLNPTNPCMPQAVQTGKSATVRILGTGFTTLGGVGTSVIVRLDGQAVITPPGQTTPVSISGTIQSDSEIDSTIPASVLFAPHDYAVDVQPLAGNVEINAIDLHVVGLLDMASDAVKGCATTSSFPQGPEGVAVDDTRHIALVTNYACNSVSVIAIDPEGFVKTDNSIAPFGTILGSVAVGKQPIGIAVIPRMAKAVVANNGETPNGTASVIDYSKPESPQIVSWPVTAGTTTPTANTVALQLLPLGVAIDQDRALALIANSGSKTLSSIDLTVLLPSDPTTPGSTTVGHVLGPLVATPVPLSGTPMAIAVDPNIPAAAVTSLQNSGSTSVTGGIDVVTLNTSPPIKSSTASISSLSASLTGIVYDPGDPNVTGGTTGVFYAASTQANAIYSFRAATGGVQTISVGINPFSLGFNYQTGTLLTINSTSNSASVVDTQNFKTRQTLGITSLSQFAIDVDKVTNTAVLVDQNNNRVVFLAMPK